MRQKWRLLKCSTVNPYARMRTRFSNSCASEKLDRSMSRFMRHPIVKNGGVIPGNDVDDGVFPRQSAQANTIHSSNAVSMLLAGMCVCVCVGGGGGLPSIAP